MSESIQPVSQSARPILQSARIDTLDLVRGFALCGILFANLMSFSGFYTLDLQQIHQLPWYDRTTLFIIDWLIESKFYALFSMLLGVGFALQVSRKSNQSGKEILIGIWYRRMLVLLFFGLTHMLFIWHGDILTLYSLLGLTLPFFLGKTTQQLLKWIVVLMIIPLLLHVLLLFTSEASFWQSLSQLTKPLKASLGYAASTQLEMRTSQEVADVFFANLFSSMQRPMSYLKTGRFFIVLAYFLIGIYLARKYLPLIQNNKSISPPSIKSILILLIPGLALSAAYAYIKAAYGSPFMVSGLGVFQTLILLTGAILLALAYIAIFVRLYQKCGAGFISRQLIKLGRMSFTNYLTQTSLCVFIFYGYGFALMGQIAFYKITFFAIGILATQVLFSHFWLKRFAQGPLETLWKKLTYPTLSRCTD